MFSKEVEIATCKYRINLMKQRGEDQNKHLIAKLYRRIRALEK